MGKSDANFKYYQARRAEIRRQHETLRLRKYGLTIEQRDELLEQQSGRCAICNLEFRLDLPAYMPNARAKNNAVHVDHDHATGKARGLLCASCNRGLGSFADDPTLLERAAAYLVKWRSVK